MPTDRSVPVLTGPTAVGKTGLALHIAASLDGEIISADSRQLYRELSIGTDTPPPEARGGIPHHLLDDRSLSEPLSAGRWAEEAARRIDAVLERRHLPLVVGGSTLYVQALVEGLADIPECPEPIRTRLNARLEVEGAQSLYDELNQVDPAFAGTLDATKSQRIVRGLEVYEATGRPLSSFFSSTRSPSNRRFDLVVLTRSRESLYARINQRVDEMLARGLVDEVQGLLEAGFDPDQPPLKTIGYREIARHLRGEVDLEAATELIKRNTRRYAKRQLTWFRRFKSALWLDLEAEGDPAQALIDRFRAQG